MVNVLTRGQAYRVDGTLILIEADQQVGMPGDMYAATVDRASRGVGSVASARPRRRGR